MFSADGIKRAQSLGVPDSRIRLWVDGLLIQDAMPELTPDEREFILTGMTPSEWDSIFGDDPNDVEDNFGSFDKDYQGATTEGDSDDL